MLPELITEVINTDTLLPRLHGILVQSSGQVINLSVEYGDLSGTRLVEKYYLSLVKLHPILRHTGLDDLPELRLIDHSVTIWIINLARDMTSQYHDVMTCLP